MKDDKRGVFQICEKWGGTAARQYCANFRHLQDVYGVGVATFMGLWVWGGEATFVGLWAWTGEAFWVKSGSGKLPSVPRVSEGGAGHSS